MCRWLGNEVAVAWGGTCAVCACMYCRQPHNLSQESRCAGLDSNPAFPEYVSFHTLIWSVLCFTAKGVLARDARIVNYVLVNYKIAVRQSPRTLVVAELDKKCPALCGTRRAHPSLPRGTRISFQGGKAAGAWGLQLTYGTEEYVELFFNYLTFLYLVLRS